MVKPVDEGKPLEEKQRVAVESQEAVQRPSKGGRLRQAIERFLTVFVYIVAFRWKRAYFEIRKAKAPPAEKILPTLLPPVEEMIQKFIENFWEKSEARDNKLGNFLLVFEYQDVEPIPNNQEKFEGNLPLRGKIVIKDPIRKKEETREINFPIEGENLTNQDVREELAHYHDALEGEYKTWMEEKKQQLFQDIGKFSKMKEVTSEIETKKTLTRKELIDVTDKLLGNRLIDKELKTLRTFIQEQASDQWIELYRTYIAQAQALQAKRPQFYSLLRDQEQTLSFSDAQQQLISLADEGNASWIKGYIHEIVSTTIFTHHQILQEALEGFLRSPRFSRDLAEPHFLTSGAPFSLRYRFAVPTIFEESNTKKAFPPEALIFYIEDPTTREVRTVEIPLPFEQKEMTHREIRENILSLIEKQGQWEKKAAQIFMQTLADFNSTETRPKGTLIDKDSLFQAFRRNPEEKKTAYEAAKKGDIFPLEDETLSLLPQKVEDKSIQDAVTISQETVNEIKTSILSSGKAHTGSGTTQIWDGIQVTVEVSYKIKRAKDGSRFIDMTTHIRKGFGGRAELKRKTQYGIPGNKKSSFIIKQIAENGLLKQDLLLAKAEFFRENYTREEESRPIRRHKKRSKG